MHLTHERLDKMLVASPVFIGHRMQRLGTTALDGVSNARRVYPSDHIGLYSDFKKDAPENKSVHQ